MPLLKFKVKLKIQFLSYTSHTSSGSMWVVATMLDSVEQNLSLQKVLLDGAFEDQAWDQVVSFQGPYS